MRQCDLLVVGAGPAGCAAAIAARAAARRLSVAVIDAARFPREKLCGGAITGGGLRELERAGLELRVPHVVARHACLRIDGVEIRVELPRPAAVVRRVELDADLVEQVRRAGCDVIERAALAAIDEDVATTGAGPIRFRTLVAADGVGGACRRALRLPQGSRVPLREVLLPEPRRPELLFDLDALATGYAWRFPCVDRGRASETYGVYSLERDPALEDRLRRFAMREGLQAFEPDRGAIRIFDVRGPFGGGRALLAGEALGVDPLAGEGIRYALWSGRIAGRLAAQALSRGRRVSLAAYRSRLLASRSGLLLALAAKLSTRLYGSDARWRRMAADRDVAAAIAALVSGCAPAPPLLALLGRWAVSPRRATPRSSP